MRVDFRAGSYISGPASVPDGVTIIHSTYPAPPPHHLMLTFCLLVAGTDLGQQQLPTPMFKDNYESRNLVCATDFAVRAAALSHKHWHFVDEGLRGKPKRGFVSRSVNASLVLQMDTRAGGNASQQTPSPATDMLLWWVLAGGMAAQQCPDSWYR